MSEIFGFTASLGRNGLIDVFAVGDVDLTSDNTGTAVFRAQAAPGQQWSPWASVGKPGAGAIAVQSITGPDGYGHLLARSADDHMWVSVHEDNDDDDFSDWTDLSAPAPGAPDDPMVFGQMSGATTGLENGIIDMVGYAYSDRPGAAMFIRSRFSPGVWGDWGALPENDSAGDDDIVSCIANERGLDIVTQTKILRPGAGEYGLCHLRRRPDLSWTDWELLDPVEGGFSRYIAVLAYGAGSEDLNLFAVGTDNIVRHSVATTDGWSQWLSLGDPGGTVTSIAAIEDGAGQLNLFAIHPDNSVTGRRQEGKAGPWTTWQSVNLNTNSDPRDGYAVILDAEGCINFFLNRPGNQGVDIVRQQDPLDGAFTPVPSLPALPI